MTLSELHEKWPCKDFGTVVDVLAANYRSTEDLACWDRATVATRHIDRSQLIDDPDADDSWRKINSLRLEIRRQKSLPPLVLVHTLQAGGDDYLFLIDGFHRFNAAHLEEASQLSAWVAHIGCCDGPAPDMDQPRSHDPSR